MHRVTSESADVGAGCARKRRCASSDAAVRTGRYEFGPFCLDEDRFELYRSRQLLRVERRVHDLLVHLIRNRERVVSMEELRATVWGGAAVTAASVFRVVRLARLALEDDAEQPTWIANIRGRGYRFIADVRAAVPVPEVSDVRQPAACDDRDRDVLVGRTAEQAQLRAALRHAWHTPSSLWLLEGEPGMGKSSLLDWCAREAGAHGLHAIEVQCREDEGAPALLPWIDVLRELSRELDVSPSQRAMSALQHLLPEIFGDSPADPAPDPRVSRFQAWEALVEILRRGAARSALVLLLDDLHRADASCVALLEFLVSRLGRTPVCFIGTVRAGGPHSDCLARLARIRRCSTLSLHALASADVQILLSAARPALASRELAERVWSQTSGNPFFVHQVIRAIPGSGIDLVGATSFAPILPQTVCKAVQAQCAILSEPARALLESATVFGCDFSATRLAGLLGAPLQRVLERLDESVRARLLMPAADRPLHYRYAHLLVRDVLYAALGAHRQTALHRAVSAVPQGESSAAGQEARRFAQDVAIDPPRRAPVLLAANPSSDRAERCDLRGSRLAHSS